MNTMSNTNVLQKNEKFNVFKSTAAKAIIIPILAICIIFAFFTPFVISGSTSVFSVIDNIQPIPHRNLEIGKDAKGITTITNDETNADFVILQLSDLHLSCSYFTKSRDIQTVQSLVKVVDNARPDLIVITGDMVFPFIYRSYCTDNETQSRAFLSIFEKMTIPYAFVFGNHDAESLSKLNKKELSDYFSNPKLKYSLYKGGKDISGEGNYIIKLLNNNGTLSQALFFIDSSERDIQQDQIDWYKESIYSLNNEAGIAYGEAIPSVVFMHIPLYEYQLAIDNDSEKILYGVCTESISTINPQCKFFEAVKEMRSTFAIFCGHDHRNTFGILYQDVLLSFCPTLDYNAYLQFFEGEELMGGQIITLKPQSDEIDILQIYLPDLENN